MTMLVGEILCTGLTLDGVRLSEQVCRESVEALVGVPVVVEVEGGAALAGRTTLAEYEPDGRVTWAVVDLPGWDSSKPHYLRPNLKVLEMQFDKRGFKNVTRCVITSVSLVLRQPFTEINPLVEVAE